jgi:hypothetical protein
MNKKITDLDFLTHLTLSLNDLIEVVDVSEDIAPERNKQLAIGELLNFIAVYASDILAPYRSYAQPSAGNPVITFTVNPAPNSISDRKVYVYRNGVLQYPGVSNDYSITALVGNTLTITLADATVASEVFQLVYWI